MALRRFLSTWGLWLPRRTLVFLGACFPHTILDCNLLGIINVSGELEVILQGNEENSNGAHSERHTED